MSEPRFSVVIPCYNQGQFLSESLESVRAQTLPPHEVIVVNDGSTDPFTVQRLRELCQPPIRLIEQENRGLAGARNSGIAQASGDWIVPLDCDDMLEPEALASYAEAIKREGDVEIWYPDIQHFGTVTDRWETEEFNAWHELWDNLMVCSSAIRRSVFERAQYNERMRSGYEDWEFYIHVSCELGVKTKNLGKPIFRYRKWGYSMLSEAHAQRDKLRQQLRLERPIYSNEERLLALKREWSPYFAIATNGESVPHALASQSFQDFKVVERSGRVRREQHLAFFQNNLGAYLFITMADMALSQALERDPFLLEKVAAICVSHSPAMVWLVGTDSPDSTYPGFLAPIPYTHDPRAPACLGYFVSTQAFFESPYIPRRTGDFAEDISIHLSYLKAGPTLYVAAGPRRGDESFDVPKVVPPATANPKFPALRRKIVSVARASGHLIELVAGEDSLTALQKSNGFKVAREVLEGERGLLHAAEAGLRKLSQLGDPPAANLGYYEGPLEEQRLSHRGKRRIDWLVATEKPRFSTSLRTDDRPAIMIALPWIIHGGVEKATIELLKGLSQDYPHIRKYVVTTEPASNEWASEVLPHVDGIFSLADMFAPDRVREELADLLVRLRIDSLLIEQSQQAYQAIPLIRQLPRRVRIVAHMHSIARDDKTGELGGYPVFVTSRYGNLIDAYATVSKTLADTMVNDFYVVPHKIKPIFLGIDNDRLATCRRKRFQQVPEPLKVLWLGRLGEEKDPLQLLRVAAAWKAKHPTRPVEFILAGAGPLERAVHETWAALKLQDTVRLLGAVPDPVDVIREADVLMMTSKFEGIPVVILEAMTAGLAIVTPTRHTSITDILSQTEAWLIDDQAHTEEYVAALEDVLAQPDVARKRCEVLMAKSATFSRAHYTRDMLALIYPEAARIGTAGVSKAS